MTGRNPFHIDNYIVTTLRERGIGWTDIANHPQVNVSRQTLLSWRHQTNFVGPRQTLSNDAIDAIISAREIECARECARESGEIIILQLLP